jgi:hypothetical protein
MGGSERRILTSIAALAAAVGIALPAADAAGPPTVIVHVATGHRSAGGLKYIEYPGTATISGRVTTPAWSRYRLTGASALTDIACVAGAGCIATDKSGDVFSASDPGNSASAWQQHNVDGSAALARVACPSATLCVAVDNQGNVAVSTDAWDATPTWAVTDIDGTNPITGVSCPSALLCVAVDSAGNALFSTDPAGGASAWSTTVDITPLYSGVYPEALTGVSCPGTNLCVAVDQFGDVVSTTDPTGGANQWTTLTVPAGQSTTVDCPSTSLCVLLSDQLGGLISTDPTGGSGAWKQIPGYPQGGTLACPSVSLCLAGDPEAENGSYDAIEAIGISPAGQARVISRHAIAGQSAQVAAFACLTSMRCVAVDNDGYALYSTNPTGLWQVQLTGQAFPFKQKPKVVATRTTTDQPEFNEIGEYSFIVHPETATRYTVTKLGPGPIRHSATSTIYVIPSSHFGGASNCTTRPTCRITARFTYRMPKQVQAPETAKPWHVYTRVSHGSYRVRGVWHRESSARIRETRIGADSYRVKVALTIDDGSGIGAYEFAFCRKQTESRDGFAFPGTDPCGQTTLPARYFG